MRCLSTTRVLFFATLVGTLSAAACSGTGREDSGTADSEELSASCSLSITQNSYDGPNAWGTIQLKNAGPSAASGYVVQFDVPSGAHCTNDAVPSGATLSPLSGSGSSAATKSNHCVFTFTGSLASGATKSFNYSTDSTSFSKASNAAASSASCGAAGSGGSGNAGSAGAGGSSKGGGGSGGSTAGGSAGKSGGTAGSSSAGSSGANVLAGCTLAGGCPLDVNCAYANPADDPLASTNPSKYDMYYACLVGALKLAGFPDPWVGQFLKGQALQEAGSIASTSSNGKASDQCGGQNCGMWAISAGAISGDTMAGGVCGVTSKDPLTGKQDNSHSYGLFQDTPGCEGTFLIPSLPAGYTCVGTGTADIVPWSMTQKSFYCESETSIGVEDLAGKKVKGVIDAVMDPMDPYYKLSIFNPAYNLFVHMTYTFKQEYEQANATATGCDPYQKVYKVVASWLNGDISNNCNIPTGGGQEGDVKYVQEALTGYKTIYGKAWPYEAPK